MQRDYHFGTLGRNGICRDLHGFHYSLDAVNTAFLSVHVLCVRCVRHMSSQLCCGTYSYVVHTTNCVTAKFREGYVTEIVL